MLYQRFLLQYIFVASKVLMNRWASGLNLLVVGEWRHCVKYITDLQITVKPVHYSFFFKKKKKGQLIDILDFFAMTIIFHKWVFLLKWCLYCLWWVWFNDIKLFIFFSFLNVCFASALALTLLHAREFFFYYYWLEYFLPCILSYHLCCFNFQCYN